MKQSPTEDEIFMKQEKGGVMVGAKDVSGRERWASEKGQRLAINACCPVTEEERGRWGSSQIPRPESE